MFGTQFDLSQEDDFAKVESIELNLQQANVLFITVTDAMSNRNTPFFQKEKLYEIRENLKETIEMLKAYEKGTIN